MDENELKELIAKRYGDIPEYYWNQSVKHWHEFHAWAYAVAIILALVGVCALIYWVTGYNVANVRLFWF